jgi:hypothetical protein
MAASTVAQYLAALPADRRAALSAVRKAINENLPDGYEEGMQFGMIGWYVPLSMYPAGYGENPKVPLPLVALASQKSGMVLHSLLLPLPIPLPSSQVSSSTRTKYFHALAGASSDIGIPYSHFSGSEAHPLTQSA